MWHIADRLWHPALQQYTQYRWHCGGSANTASAHYNDRFGFGDIADILLRLLWRDTRVVLHVDDGKKKTTKYYNNCLNIVFESQNLYTHCILHILVLCAALRADDRTTRLGYIHVGTKGPISSNDGRCRRKGMGA